jgi:hypothetical protein
MQYQFILGLARISHSMASLPKEKVSIGSNIADIRENDIVLQIQWEVEYNNASLEINEFIKQEDHNEFLCFTKMLDFISVSFMVLQKTL